MKKKNLLSISLLSCAMLMAAVGCGNSDGAGEFKLEGTDVVIPLKGTYRTTYATEMDSPFFNYLANSWTQNSYHYGNMVDGMVENDKYGNVVGAVAKEWSSNDAGDVWTFVIKNDVKWVNNKDGKFYDYVKAEDFVTSIKYVLDPAHASPTAVVVTPVIKNAQAYYDGKGTDETSDDVEFSEVGVKVGTPVTKDGQEYETVVYTLENPTPYFPTCLTYSPYLPLNAKYLEEQGSEFGATQNNILVNGAFRLTEHTYESRIVYTKNDSYWDKDHVYVNKVVRTYIPDTAGISWARERYEAGEIDGFVVNASDADGYAKYVTGGTKDNPGEGTDLNPADASCNAVLTRGDATYVGYFNFAREKFVYNVGDGVVQKSTDQQKAAQLAIRNKKLRQSILYGLKIENYLKRYNANNPYQYLMRTFTIPELASAGNKDYIDYVNEEYNEKQGLTGGNKVTLNGFDMGKDPVLNQTKARSLLEAAKAELIADGTLQASDFPVYLDVNGTLNATTKVYEDAMFDDFNETVGTGILQFNQVVANNGDQYNEWGKRPGNYDFSMFAGWGPDYADPATFLNCFAIDGDMVDSIGFYHTGDAEHDAANDALQQQILGAYDELVEAGNALTSSSEQVARFEKFAEAEYQLIYEDAIVIPWLTETGYRTQVSNVVPYQVMKATYGLCSDRFKYIQVAKTAITQEQRAAIKLAYDNGK